MKDRILILEMIALCGITLFFWGFKLEKDPIQMTQTEVKKAPAPDEAPKVREVPVSPSFTSVGSMDKFMTRSSVSAEKKAVASVKTVLKPAVSGMKPSVSAQPSPAKVSPKTAEDAAMDELMMEDSEEDTAPAPKPLKGKKP